MNAIPVDTVVFDLGGVLISWDPHPAIAKTVGQDQATRFLADEAFDFIGWNYQQDAGRSWDGGEDWGLGTQEVRDVSVAAPAVEEQSR